MKVELKEPPKPAVEIVITLTLEEAQALRHATDGYLLYVRGSELLCFWAAFGPLKTLLSDLSKQLAAKDVQAAP